MTLFVRVLEVISAIAVTLIVGIIAGILCCFIMSECWEPPRE